jgi:hypothetical protein
MMSQYPWMSIHLSLHKFIAPTLTWTRTASRKKGNASIAETGDIWHAIVPEKRNHRQRITHSLRRNLLTNLKCAKAQRSLAPVKPYWAGYQPQACTASIKEVDSEDKEEEQGEDDISSLATCTARLSENQCKNWLKEIDNIGIHF